MRRIQDGLADEVRILNERLMYLNNLRVGVGRFYVLIIGGVFASAALRDVDLLAVFRFAGIPMLLVGVSVLVFDAMVRARAGAVARGIRSRTLGETEESGSVEDEPWRNGQSRFPGRRQVTPWALPWGGLMVDSRPSSWYRNVVLCRLAYGEALAVGKP